jgi:hypothetical protein
MKQQASQVEARVEIMIIKNSGRNWRSVDAEINPSGEAIVQRTVQFFVQNNP